MLLFYLFGGNPHTLGVSISKCSGLQVPADLADCYTMYEIVNATTGLGFMTDALYVTGLAGAELEKSYC